jgi:hypothetical protein
MKMNNELAETWKEVTVVQLMVLSRYLPGGAEENLRVDGVPAEI